MNISAREVCRSDLYTPRDELMKKYPRDTVQKVLRVRDMHQMLIDDPTRSHRDLVKEISCRYKVSEQSAYSDLKIVKELLPTLTESTKAFDRYLANEMYMEIYRLAKEKGDLGAMERAASNFAKYNDIGSDDEKEVEFIPVQPFIPTSDPTVLGLKPIPNLRDEINRLLTKYRRETVDIEDVTYEEADLQEQKLFAPIDPNPDGTQPAPAL